MQERLARLQKERNSLLADWARASEREKARLLARIIEIDDQLELYQGQGNAKSAQARKAG